MYFCSVIRLSPQNLYHVCNQNPIIRSCFLFVFYF
uniref:Uncharacterized protein n=1 Tax=Anguilla anguilla TaxID=7936 RepID=A0A0E9QNE3_ANGAN